MPSSLALKTGATPGAFIAKLRSGKTDVVRYFNKLAGGFFQFDASGTAVVTDSPTICGMLNFAPSATPTVTTTVGVTSFTAAQILNGVIARDPNGAARADTLDTAANLISGLGLTANYMSRQFLLVNTADAAETITVTTATGVTIKGTITCEQNTAIRIEIFRTGPSTVTARQV